MRSQTVLPKPQFWPRRETVTRRRFIHHEDAWILGPMRSQMDESRPQSWPKEDHYSKFDGYPWLWFFRPLEALKIFDGGAPAEEFRATSVTLTSSILGFDGKALNLHGAHACIDSAQNQCRSLIRYWRFSRFEVMDEENRFLQKENRLPSIECRLLEPTQTTCYCLLMNIWHF